MLGKQKIPKLTKKQKAFADNYIKTGIAESSAVKAGYSDNYAKSQSYKLLEYIGIKDYIRKRLDRVDSKVLDKQVNVHEAVNKTLTQLMGIDVFNQEIVKTKAFEVDDNGNTVSIEKQNVPVRPNDLIKLLELKAKLEQLFDNREDDKDSVDRLENIVDKFKGLADE